MSAAAAWVVLTVTFLLIHALPGGPFGTRIEPLAQAILGQKYGLDRPLVIQYLAFFAHLLHGNLGRSIASGQPVAQILAQTLPVSGLLAVLALLWGVPLGVVMGVLVGRGDRRWWSLPLRLLATCGVAVPAFVVAVALDWLLGLHWRLLPLGGWGTPAQAVLPVVALGLFPMGAAFRLVSAETAQTLGQTWWLAAEARGLPARVRWRYLLGPAVRSLLAVLPPLGAGLLTGTLLVEPIFGIPGFGSELLQAIFARDTPVVLGGVLAIVAAFLLLSLAVDGLFVALDPRLRHPEQTDIRRRGNGRPRRARVMDARQAARPELAVRAFLEDVAFPAGGQGGAPPQRGAPPRPSGGVALFMIAALVVGSLLVVWLDPWGYGAQHLALRNAGASASHWLGTDPLGRDLLARLAAGTLVSLAVACLAALLDLCLGLPVGLVLGWVGGGAAVLDLLSSVPMLLVALGLLSLLGPGLVPLVVALAVGGWLPMARVVRGQTMALRQRTFIRAALGLGLPVGTIWWRHLGPHLVEPVLATMGLTVPGAIFAEAALSFWGIGVQPPLPSLGRLIASGYQVLSLYPRETLWPLVAVVWLVWWFQVFVDGRPIRSGVGSAGR